MDGARRPVAAPTLPFQTVPPPSDTMDIEEGMRRGGSAQGEQRGTRVVAYSVGEMVVGRISQLAPELDRSVADRASVLCIPSGVL